MTEASDDKRHFFVSFNQADRGWATWIAWVLEEKGYSVFFQDWDFRGSFIEQMHQASLRAGRTLVVLSDHYLHSEYARSEAWAALARDPVGREDRVVTIKVGPTGNLGLFSHFAYLDLTTSAEADAERLILERARTAVDPDYRAKPTNRPGFPGGAERKVPKKPPFPGVDPPFWGRPMVLAIAITAIIASVVAAGAFYRTLNSVELTLFCGTGGKELEACEIGVAEWQNTKWWKSVNVHVMPHDVDTNVEDKSIDTRFRHYENLLMARYGANGNRYDIYQIDVNWVNQLSKHLYNLDYEEIKAQGHLSAILEAGTRDGRLVAVPWSANFGVLYYNKRLLENYNQQPVAPETWGDLYRISTAAQRHALENNKYIYGFGFQGRQYEGLTCNALEWIYSYYDDTTAQRTYMSIIDNTDVELLKTFASWITTISPPDVKDDNEDRTYKKFINGNIIFMRHWISSWAELDSVNSGTYGGHFGIDLLPKGDRGQYVRHATTLGGWLLAVDNESPHKEEAAELITYLASPEVQVRRFREKDQIPTIAAVAKEVGNRKISTILNILLDEGHKDHPMIVTRLGGDKDSAKFQKAVWKGLFAASAR